MTPVEFYEKDAWAYKFSVTDEDTGDPSDLSAATAEAFGCTGLMEVVTLDVQIIGSDVIVSVPKDTLSPGFGEIQATVTKSANDIQTFKLDVQILAGQSTS